MTAGLAPGPSSGRARRALPLSCAEVHVWHRSLAHDDKHEELAGLLSTDERLRAARFVFERDAVRYVVGRATLRQILGAYLAVTPERIAFSYGPQGKPALAWPREPLAFNVSHSGDVALYAVSWDRRLGVDVELVRQVDDLNGLAAQVFAVAERTELASLAPDQRVRAFFDGWTRKEAFVKAVGEGLSHPLHTFVVSLDPATPARLVAVGDRAGATSGWSLHALAAGTGYSAALVAEGEIQTPTCRTWTA
jgi:4'-phosphopantetheinyl transferase